MEWRDSAIILSSKPYGENSLLVRVLSEAHGLYAGMVRLSKKSRALVQPGNLVDAKWSARLPEHLGSFVLESQKPYAALIIHDAARLESMLSALTMVASSLPERDAHPAIYVSMLEFLSALTHQPPEIWLKEYVLLELELLKELGFGLDLSCCAATGTMEDLVYVSPKSACAVSRAAGAPYHDRLLPLPPFLLGNHKAGAEDIFKGLRLTGYFLEKHLLEHHQFAMPAARERFLSHISRIMESCTA